MTILGIETSCDETSAAILTTDHDTVALRSNIVASSLLLHAQTGGIIPEVAAREQVKYILPVIDEALKKGLGINILQVNNITVPPIDAIAVTYGPGLIGSLLVGIETAKTLAYAWKKPLIPINHLIGHIYANWIEHQDITFPALALIVSGGHTDLVLMQDHKKMHVIGGTRDDAAGEAFDKIGRLLGLPYPAGPVIEKLATQGNPKAFHFPRPLLSSSDFDFSFSGLKTAVLREVQKGPALTEMRIKDIARGVQDAITAVLVTKTIKAARQHSIKSLLLSGGVAANQTLRDEFSVISAQSGIKFFAPAKNLCTDNAAMIASAAYFHAQPAPWKTVSANPELYF